MSFAITSKENTKAEAELRGILPKRLKEISMKLTIKICCLLFMFFTMVDAGSPATIFHPTRGLQYKIGDTITIATYFDTLMLKSIGCEPIYFNLSISFDNGFNWQSLASINYVFRSNRPQFGGHNNSVLDTLIIQDSTRDGYNLKLCFVANEKSLDSIVKMSSTPVSAIFRFSDEASGKLGSTVISEPIYFLSSSTATSYSRYLVTGGNHSQSASTRAVTLNGRVLPAKYHVTHAPCISATLKKRIWQ